MAESLDELQALAGEIDAWHARWDQSYAVSKHRTQLDFLTNLTGKLIAVLTDRTRAIDPATGIGAVYDECHLADLRLAYVRRLWRYYADKFDQRAGPDDNPLVLTLRAADEVIWSCWKTALKRLGTSPEFHAPAPLAYLAPQFAASATLRTEFPDDFRPLNEDKLLKTHIEQLPIPVIALPPMCQRRPWWLVVAAHEVGHHIQRELSEFEQGTRSALAGPWKRWYRELFADACGVLLAGPAVIWAITELETRPAAALGKSLDPDYPPPLVRLAVIRAIAEKAGLQDSFPPERDVTGLPVLPPGDERQIESLLADVPAVADALLGLASDGGKELRGLAGSYDKRVVAYWHEALLSQQPVAEQSLDAARFCAAGSVAAWQSVAGEDSSGQRLADRTTFLARQVLGVLPGCTEPGTRGRPERDGTSAEDLARQFATDLYAPGLFTGDQFLGGASQP